MLSLTSELPEAEARLEDLDDESSMRQLCPQIIKSVDWWNLTHHLSARRLKELHSYHGTKVTFVAPVNHGEAPSRAKAYQTMDAAIIPRPPAMDVVSQLPSAHFSILQSALLRTGLAAELADNNGPRSTLFAPSDTAFRKLGKQVTSFLFDRDGLGYLHALLKYHMVPSQQLWSSAFENLTGGTPTSSAVHPHSSNRAKGNNSFLLPTMLAGRELSIDVSQFGGLVSVLANGSTPVAVQDGAASSGLVHFVDGVLLPGIVVHKGLAAYEAEVLGVGEFKSRLGGC